MLCPFRRRRVIFVNASMVLWWLRAVCSSCVIVVAFWSVVVVVRLPSKSMRLFLVWVAIWVCSHLSRSAVMRVCVWLRSGRLVNWWSGLFLCWLWAGLCSWNRLSMSC